MNLLKINNGPIGWSGITFTLNKDGSIHANGISQGGQARCYLLSHVTLPMDCIIGIRVKYGESSVQGEWRIWSDTLRTNIYSGYRCKSGTSTGGWFIYSEPSYGDEIDADLYVWVEPGYKLHNFVPYTGDTGYINSDLSASRAIIGDSDISSIGDGTITNAITTLESRITTLENS